MFLLLVILAISPYIFAKKQRDSNQLSAGGAIRSYGAGGQYTVLTFDGGPHHIFTPKILDILKRSASKATFFVQGSKALRNKVIVRRMQREGHEVGIMGWNFENFTDMPLPKLSAQINKSFHAIPLAQNISTEYIRGQAVKSNLRHIRPPHGLTNDTINSYIYQNHQVEVVLWSIDSQDLSSIGHGDIVTNIMKVVKPGDIILCHDITEKTIYYLPLLIDSLHAKSFEILSVSNMRSFPDDTPRKI